MSETKTTQQVKTVTKWENSLEYLRGKLATVNDLGVVLACVDLLSDASFLNGTAAVSKHHAYRGGLVVHTAEVLKGALAQQQYYTQASRDVLVAASIFHDSAKIRDYEVVVASEENPTGYRYTDYAKKIHHISGSYSVWKTYANFYQVPIDLQDAVGHCILAHHGRPEWGSPVVPQTLEATILHNADMLSAFYGKDAKLD